MIPGEFFSALRPWSYYKHTILQKYLRVWANKLGSANSELYFVDTHAGAGSYESGEPGSPVLAAQMNADPGFARQGAALHVIACEQDPNNALFLAEALAPWTDRPEPLARVLPGSFKDHLPQIVEFTRLHPTLYFLDSFGMADVSLDALTPLLQARERKKEILLRLDHTMFARWAGWLVERERSAASQRAAERFKQLLAECAIDPETARELKREQPHGIGEELMYEYLHAFRHRFNYVTVAPIRATFTGAPRYFLLHATDSAHGCAHMNDVVSTTRDDLYRRTESQKSLRSGQTNLFAPEELETPRDLSTEEIDFEIIGQLRQVNRASWIEVRASLACELGPEFREKDHRAALKRLVRAQKVQCSDGDDPKPSSVLTLR